MRQQRGVCLPGREPLYGLDEGKGGGASVGSPATHAVGVLGDLGVFAGTELHSGAASCPLVVDHQLWVGHGAGNVIPACRGVIRKHRGMLDRDRG